MAIEEHGVVSSDITSQIKKEARSQAIKYTISVFVFLFIIAGTGWGFYLKRKVDDYIADRVQQIPKQAVVAFDSSEGCPEGWASFEDGKGRLLVGAGKGENLSSRPFRSMGGAEAVTLGEGNIPLHQHDTLVGVIHAAQWGVGPIKTAIAGASLGTFTTALTSPYGKATADPIAIIPPFIALTFCKKN